MGIAVIVTPFDNYSFNVRVKYLEKYLASYGYEVMVLSSDWDHRGKCPYFAKRDNLELLHVPPYCKNLSMSRIYSHYIFARKVVERIDEIKPEVVYGSTPPNFLISFLGRYKKRNPNVKLIFEVGDLWPETLPLNKKMQILALPFLKIWSALRDRYIHNSDGVIFECDLFRNIVLANSKTIDGRTIYLCKENALPENHCPEIDSRNLRFAYVGSINNIIDIHLIVDFLTSVNKYKTVCLDVIGAGETAGELFDLCRIRGIECRNHGVIYDDARKYEILKHCQFGFNIMKDSVVVGATMKSLEYFHWGLAVINNISADTADIVNRYGCGRNIDRRHYENVAAEVAQMRDEDIASMMASSRKVYEELFDERTISVRFKKFTNHIFNKAGIQ